jgi:sulfhydrogenase subunit beta (sulfur reductase)
MNPGTVAHSKKFISRAQINTWLDDLARNRILIAPSMTGDVTLYRQVTGKEQINWNDRPVLSVKEVFFPATEQLFTIQKRDGSFQLSETLPNNNQIVFGVRACEARGIKLLDSLFLENVPTDPYFLRRRQLTTMIGVACRELGPTCFCTSVGGSPDNGDDMDLMLHEVEDGFIIEVVSEKGNTLISDLALADFEQEIPRQEFPEPAYPNPAMIPWKDHFNDDYWQQISERCLSCRACAYVCPTCHCFDIRDETNGRNEFDRIRCWDSCQGINYRRLAGGHRQRAEKGERLRNRFFCKFDYLSEQSHSEIFSSCTGCGRCIDICPVGVDITEVLQDLGRSA